MVIIVDHSALVSPGDQPMLRGIFPMTCSEYTDAGCVSRWMAHRHPFPAGPREQNTSELGSSVACYLGSPQSSLPLLSRLIALFLQVTEFVKALTQSRFQVTTCRGTVNPEELQLPCFLCVTCLQAKRAQSYQSVNTCMEETTGKPSQGPTGAFNFKTSCPTLH